MITNLATMIMILERRYNKDSNGGGDCLYNPVVLLSGRGNQHHQKRSELLEKKTFTFQKFQSKWNQTRTEQKHSLSRNFNPIEIKVSSDTSKYKPTLDCLDFWSWSGQSTIAGCKVERNIGGRKNLTFSRKEKNPDILLKRKWKNRWKRFTAN